MFSFQIKFFTLSHRMFGHMHRVLNVEKKTIIQFARKLRDKSFKPNCVMISQFKDVFCNLFVCPYIRCDTPKFYKTTSKHSPSSRSSL